MTPAELDELMAKANALHIMAKDLIKTTTVDIGYRGLGEICADLGQDCLVLIAAVRERDARIAELKQALKSAVDDWEYAANYKGYLAEKHNDFACIAEVRERFALAALKESGE